MESTGLVARNLSRKRWLQAQRQQPAAGFVSAAVWSARLSAMQPEERRCGACRRVLGFLCRPTPPSALGEVWDAEVTPPEASAPRPAGEGDEATAVLSAGAGSGARQRRTAARSAGGTAAAAGGTAPVVVANVVVGGASQGPVYAADGTLIRPGKDD